MSEVYYKCIRSIKAKLSPTYLILILATSSPIVVSLPFLGGRFLFRTRKPVKYLPKLYLFTTWSNITFLNFVGVSIKSAGYS